MKSNGIFILFIKIFDYFTFGPVLLSYGDESQVKVLSNLFSAVFFKPSVNIQTHFINKFYHATIRKNPSENFCAKLLEAESGCDHSV